MASKEQSILELGRLCSVGSPAAASVLRRLFETVEQLKQAIVDEWCALYQKFIDRPQLPVSAVPTIIAVSTNGDDVYQNG